MNNEKILEDLKKSLEEILKEPFAKDEMYNGNLYEYERGYELDLEEIKVVLILYKKNKELKDTNKKLYELCQGKAIQEFINNECGYIPKSKVKELKEKIHNLLDDNGITRAYELEIDKYFEDLEKGE